MLNISKMFSFVIFLSPTYHKNSQKFLYKSSRDIANRQTSKQTSYNNGKYNLHRWRGQQK